MQEFIFLIVVVAVIYFVVKRKKAEKESIEDTKRMLAEQEARKKKDQVYHQTPAGNLRQTKPVKPDHLKYSKVRKLVTDYVVLDFETTGFDCNKNKIIQIGAVRYRNFEKVDQFVTYVNPQSKISTKITSITGITDSDVTNAPLINEVLPELLKFIDKDTVVAHNASFDMKFLLQNMHNCNIGYQKFRVLDTLTLARKSIDTPNHKLETLKTFLNMDHHGSHDSLEDCLVTGELYKYCYEKLSVAV